MRNLSRIYILIGAVLGMSLTAVCGPNAYTLRNNSCIGITVSVWFTNAIKGSRKIHEGEYGSGMCGILPNALPAPDMQFNLEPRGEHTISDQEGVVQIGECLAYLVAEYKVIPSMVPALQTPSGIPGDLYMIGKRSWAQKLPGLCGINTIDMNYDPSTYLKFTIKINGVEDYFQDVSKIG